MTYPNANTRAKEALEGLSLGDAFGERFFLHTDHLVTLFAARALPKGPWKFTDDTEMAISIYETVLEHNEIDQDALASRFAARYMADNMRGYGRGAHSILQQIAAGESWKEAAGAVFGGSGSYGNGGAMRVAPLGAYFAEDLSTVAREAARSAEVTHANPEGIAGAIAIALAAAEASRQRANGDFAPDRLFETVLEFLPKGATRQNVEDARNLARTESVAVAADKLGTGQAVSAQDTVGFSIWCAARHLNDFEEAMWTTVAGLGDRDTTCAIVGGIVASYVGLNGLPSEWLGLREALPVA